MSRFYIDTSDQDFFHRDDTESEVEDIEEAKNASVGALPDMAREALPDGDANLPRHRARRGRENPATGHAIASDDRPAADGRPLS